MVGHLNEWHWFTFLKKLRIIFLACFSGAVKLKSSEINSKSSTEWQ